jgi:hypothetical protein
VEMFKFHLIDRGEEKEKNSERELSVKIYESEKRENFLIKELTCAKHMLCNDSKAIVNNPIDFIFPKLPHRSNTNELLRTCAKIMKKKSFFEVCRIN